MSPSLVKRNVNFHFLPVVISRLPIFLKHEPLIQSVLGSDESDTQGPHYVATPSFDVTRAVFLLSVL